MSWSQVIGHDREKKILQRSIIDEKLAHAYLFKGIEGVGKEALAIQFAKTANCREPIISMNSIDSCEKCKSCKEFNNLSSNNLELVFPLPTGKSQDSRSDDPYGNYDSETIQMINDELQIKANNYYHKINLPKANQIKISSIRLIKRKLSLSGNVSGRRFVLISEAHNITNEASNAFLKTLEEPHENITIILCTSRPEQILQTIISRCQVINCSPVPAKVIAAYLTENKGFDEIQAKIAAQFGQGSITKAIDSVSDNLKNNRDQIVDILRTSVKKRSFRSELIEKIQNLLKEHDKKQIQNLLILLILWIRDAKNILIDSESMNIINTDDIDTISKFAIHFQNTDMQSAIFIIEEHINMIDANVNINLLIITLFFKLRQIFIDVS